MNISSCKKVTLLRDYNLKATVEVDHQTPCELARCHNPWLFLANSILAWIPFLQLHQNKCIGNQGGMRKPDTRSEISTHIYLMGLKKLITDWMCPPYCPVYNCTWILKEQEEMHVQHRWHLLKKNISHVSLIFTPISKGIFRNCEEYQIVLNNQIEGHVKQSEIRKLTSNWVSRQGLHEPWKVYHIKSWPLVSIKDICCDCLVPSAAEGKHTLLWYNYKIWENDWMVFSYVNYSIEIIL